MFLELGCGTYKGELCTLEPPYQQSLKVNMVKDNGSETFTNIKGKTIDANIKICITRTDDTRYSTVLLERYVKISIANCMTP